MDNMEIYEKVRTVPQEAKKEIKAGRLKGFTDINPMWRIKLLTQTFGPCGIGWKYVIKREWMEQGANGEIAAFMDIDLFYMMDGEWSEAIPGTGGASFVAKERNGMYTSDECYKMALTDAISVATKALGFGADVYWDKDRTKYSGEPELTKAATDQATGQPILKCECCGYPIIPVKCDDGKTISVATILKRGEDDFSAKYCYKCLQLAVKKRKAEQALNGYDG